MKIVVIGGTGLIGSKVVTKLGEHGHEAVAGVARHGRQHAHRRGTRRGRSRAPSGRRRLELAVVRGRARCWSSSTTSTRNLLAAEAAAGVGHHVALSVVGTERLADERLLPRQDRAGEADRGLRRSRTRSCTRRSSSSSSRASPRSRPTATRSGSRPCCSSRWRPRTSPSARRPDRGRRAGERHRRDRRARSSSASTSSSAQALKARDDPRRSWPTRRRCTSATTRSTTARSSPATTRCSARSASRTGSSSQLATAS